MHLRSAAEALMPVPWYWAQAQPNMHAGVQAEALGSSSCWSTLQQVCVGARMAVHRSSLSSGRSKVLARAQPEGGRGLLGALDVGWWCRLAICLCCL